MTSYKKTALRQISVVRVRSGDTIVVRKWAGITKDDRQELVDALRKRAGILNGVTLLFVDRFSDIRTLNEEQMRANGWVRASG